MDKREKTDQEAAPRYKNDDTATLTEEGKTSTHKIKAGDALAKAGIDGDEALKALELEEGETIVIDDDTNRKLLRKIGFRWRRQKLIVRLAYYATSLHYIRTAVSG